MSDTCSSLIFFPRKNSIIKINIGYEKTNPIPTATVFNSIDLNIVDQCMASKGPRKIPE